MSGSAVATSTSSDPASSEAVWSPEEFPHRQRVTWLNHAGTSLPSRSVRAAIDGYLDRSQTQGTWRAGWCEELIARARRTAADTIGCSPAEIALTKSTTHGLVIVANSVTWRLGENIVVLADDFPANLYPWRNVATEEHIEVRDVPPCCGGHHKIEAILDWVDDRTRLVSVCWVNFANGRRLDVVGLGKALRERGVLFCIDAIQGLGAMPLSAADSQADFITAGSHKWMLGPEGSGFLFIRDGIVRDQMNTRAAGWLGVERPHDYADRQQDFVLRAERFEEGARNMIGLSGMTASMNLLMRARGQQGDAVRGTADTSDPVFAKILALGDRLLGALIERGWWVGQEHGEHLHRSGIITFKHPNRKPEEVVAALDSQDIVASARLGSVRVSPHYYASFDDIDRLVAVLDTL